MFKLLPIFLLLSACGFKTVDTGNRGIKIRFGEIIGEPLSEGLYFFNPFTTGITEYPVREGKWEGSTQVFTKDTQAVTITFAVNFFPNPNSVGKLYKQYGHASSLETAILQPAMLAALKDAVGKINADDLVGNRETAKDHALDAMKKSLQGVPVNITALNFVNLDFEDKYEKAVEDKVVATQEALKAKNETVKIEEEAKQKVKTAEAEATSMRIKSEALSKNQNLVQFELAQRWDGKLPQTVLGNSVPLLNLSDFKK